ncbi:MAG: DUF4280 domain-containing protein [Flavobacteriaceae bacterium]|nr:DUF4280 domain-containing protein [Flavobacteriaceae bacterium]
MADKKYVPQGVYLACDKGTTPTEFKITNNNNVFLFEEPVANTGDMAPNVNILPFGSCSAKGGSPCMPVPTPWQGFEDGIFIGNFNPLLEDSIMQCGVGGKIEIFYSLEEAEAASDDGGMSFWEIVGAAVLVVAAVALIVVTGGAVLAAVAAVGAASGALATTVAVGVLALEVTALALEVKALYDYTQDGDEEALFKGVALGFMFLGAGKLVGKGFDMYQSKRAANLADEAFDGVKQLDEVADPPGTFRDPNGKLRNKDGTFAKDPKAVKFNRSTAERKKALMRDALDSDSGLSDRARKQILDSKGNKVPKGHEVSHEKPLYTGKTVAEKKALDRASNMKTQQKSVHRKRHMKCGDQYHDFPI